MNDLLRRRRAMMEKNAEEQEEWDYVFRPDETGTIPRVNLRDGLGVILERGQTATIAWDFTGYEPLETSHLYHGSGELAEPRSMLQKDLPSEKGELIITAAARRPEVRISANWYLSTEPYRFRGRYIKLRINPI